MVFSQRISSALRPTSFGAGAIQHVTRKISGHPLGITACRRFTVVKNEALISGRKTSLAKGRHKMHGTEDSKIRDAGSHSTCIGIAIGTGIGAASTYIGIALGTGIGIALGIGSGNQ